MATPPSAPIVSLFETHPPLTFGQALRRRKWSITAVILVVLLTSGGVYPILPRTYNSNNMVLLQPTDNTGQPIVGRSTLNALDENEIQAYDDILSSRPMLLQVIQQLHLLDDPEFNPSLKHSRFKELREWIRAILLLPDMRPDEAVEATLKKHLFITRSHKSYALQIGFWSESPTKAAAMANALAGAFVANRLDNKIWFQNHLTEQLDLRRIELAKAFDDSEGKMHAFLVQSGLIHRGERAAMEGQLATLSGQYAQAISLADITEDRAKSMLDMLKQGTVEAAPDVMNSSVIRNLKERLMTLTSGTGSGPQASGGISASPANLAELKAQIATEALRIVKSVQADAGITRAHANALKAEITQIDTKIVAWKEAERQLELLEREVEADRIALKDTMTQLRAQGGIIAALRSDAYIISPATISSRPSFPNLLLYAMGTVFVALLLAGCVMLPSLFRATSRQTQPSHVRYTAHQ